MSEEFSFEYMTDDFDKEFEKNEQVNEMPLEDTSQFVKGLPDWDLEPPYELVRRKDL